MATPATIDIESLLQDIPGDSPCGESLAFDPLWEEIKDSRPQADRDALVEGEGSSGDWSRIIRTCSDVLVQRSKHLTIGCHLVEALTHQHGFAGLRDGLRVLTGLLERYWDGIFPPIDTEEAEQEEQVAARVAPLVWLTEESKGARLPNFLRDIPITPPGMEGETYGLTDYNRRNPQPKGGDEDEDSFNRRRREAEAIAKKVNDAIAVGKPEFYLTLHQDLTETLASVAEFGSKADEKFGFTAPATTAIKKVLEESENLIRRIADDKGAFAIPDQEGGDIDGTGDDDGGDHDDTGGGKGGRGPLKSRKDALARLQEVATYLRSTEPHSPVSYLVERAVHWSDMPLDRLLQEIVKDQDSLGFINELLGIRGSEE